MQDDMKNASDMTDGFQLINIDDFTFFCFMRNWGGIQSWCVSNLPYLTKRFFASPLLGLVVKWDG